MTQEHPITPPPELVRKWGDVTPWTEALTQAARWGADQELEACCEWVHETFKEGFAWCSELRAVRRPKPPSLKQQAFDSFDFIGKAHALAGPDWAIIRRALEALPDD